MSNIEDRLNKIEEKITEPAFLKNKGLGNEVGYYIFDYSPKDELHVRNHIAYLKDKINRSGFGFQIVEFDLYKLIINILEQEGYLENCFKQEQSAGFNELADGLSNMLGLDSTDQTNLIVTTIVNNFPPNSVVFLTGVGKCYPFVRSHNVLNNLHQVLDSVPVVMFYPGRYSGQNLQLFGTIKDDNYYRAFPLV
jgi:hypothetical protein